MNIFIYDYTFEGLLTCIFDAYFRKTFPDLLLKEGEPLPLFYDETFHVSTDERKAMRVWRGLEKKISHHALSALTYCWLSELPEVVAEQVEIFAKYEGYINKQKQEVEKALKLENKKIPADIDYLSIKELSSEAAEKLAKVKPASIGQASRISGVSPADVSVLMIALEVMRRKEYES